MSNPTLVISILALGVIGFFAGRRKALGATKKLHSLPRYYGSYVAIYTVVPAVLLIALWLALSPIAVNAPVFGQITPNMIPDGGSADLIMSEIHRLAVGLDYGRSTGLIDVDALGAETNLSVLANTLSASGVMLSGDLNPEILSLALDLMSRNQASHMGMVIVAIIIAFLGFAFSYRRVAPEFWARNAVERVYLGVLILASAVAILTTLGIVMSMAFETTNFFKLHNWVDFFFGTEWAPNFRGDSALSILPLLWGTLYISLVALLVAVPIGLYAAIYLSEYASRPVRSIAKPMLEVLAGIPTIVYGLFALVVFGPFLKDWFGDGGYLGVNWMADARSVATAGIVMGIMLIPFVSSLSDDIINAVPQSLRDGSYGLGATQSETVKQVVLPAALPGIVGAILLAASRAIGETMIVVLGAGAIARFTGNPLEALTTITTRIVSQLTGDGDFNSPETLVAFALGLTLFVITLGLNIIALIIVRKYREQYE